MALDHARLKLDRAKEHLAEFTTGLDEFAGQKPYPLHAVTFTRSNEIRDIVWLKNPDDDRWSVLVGDCVHNLRCVLDHIAWEFAGGNDKAPTHTEFPIFQDGDRFYDKDRKGNPSRGSGLWKLQGFTDPRAIDLVEELQPFASIEPERHPLWVLHELDRVDKHRSLHLVTGWTHDNIWAHGINATDAASLPPGWRQIRATQSPTYPSQTPAGQRTRVKFRFDLALRVMLAKGTAGSHDILDVLLSQLVAFVEDKVLARFSELA